MEWRPAGCRCVCLCYLPCTINSRRLLLALAHAGRPQKRAVKWLCVSVCVHAKETTYVSLLCNHTKCTTRQLAIVDIRLRPHCALPSPPSQLIGRITCAQNFLDISYLCLPGIMNDPFCCMTLLVTESSGLQRTWQRRLQRRLPVLLNGPHNPHSSYGHRQHAQKSW